jgi:transcriptional regulator GlxA family with amidase domain
MFIEANARETLRLQDIAAAANVPARTLLDGFRRFRQTSPGRFLRDLRLDRARESLIERDGEASVTTAALEAGFTHLGRFARAYADRFGEKPSETLARSSKRRSGPLRRD